MADFQNTVMPAETLPQLDIEHIKLGVWGVIRVLYYGLDCVFKEFDRSDMIDESAFPLEPYLNLAEEVRVCCFFLNSQELTFEFQIIFRPRD